jgi:hypothetical protein
MYSEQISKFTAKILSLPEQVYKILNNILSGAEKSVESQPEKTVTRENSI